MTRKIKKALEDSIKHWEENLERLIKNKGKRNLVAKISIGGDSCPLCEALDECAYLCCGCLVAKKTGLSNCQGSPWMDVSNIMGRHRSSRSKNDFDDLKISFINEIEFLKGLRENAKPRPVLQVRRKSKVS